MVTEATLSAAGTRCSYPVRSRPITRKAAAKIRATAAAPFHLRNTRKVLSSSIWATKAPTTPQITMDTIMPVSPMLSMEEMTMPREMPPQKATPYRNTGRMNRKATMSPADSKARRR